MEEEADRRERKNEKACEISGDQARDRTGAESGRREVFEGKASRLTLRLEAGDAVFDDVEPGRIAVGEPTMAFGQLPAPVELAGERRARIVFPAEKSRSARRTRSRTSRLSACSVSWESSSSRRRVRERTALAGGSPSASRGAGATVIGLPNERRAELRNRCFHV